MNDRLNKRADIIRDIGRLKPHDFVAVIAQAIAAKFVLSSSLCVMRSVDLDRELCLWARKVDDVRTDRMLPAKFEWRGVTIAQASPQLTFKTCLALTQIACGVDVFFDVRFHGAAAVVGSMPLGFFQHQLP